MIGSLVLNITNLLLQTNSCLTALARLEQAQCLFSGVQTTVCAHESAKTPWKSMRGTSGYCIVNDNPIVNLNGRWSQGCGGAAAVVKSH